MGYLIAGLIIDFNGHAMDALLVSTYLGPEMHILIPRVASRHIPEAEAVCGSSARTDLCGGAAGNCRPYRDHASLCTVD